MSYPRLKLNIQAAYDVLVKDGPQRPEVLRARLAEDGIELPVPRLIALPERHPHAFTTTPDGRLAAVVEGGEAAPGPRGRWEADPSPDGARWWQEAAAIPPADPATVAVIDIETTDLDVATARVWEIGACWLGREGTLWLRVELPPGERPALPLPPVEDGTPAIAFPEAWDRLLGFLRGATMIAGHNLRAFDLPVLQQEAGRYGLDPLPDLPACDLLELSLLVEPTSGESRSLAALCQRYAVKHAGAHRALPDAQAAAAALRAMLARVSGSDPSWALARACLARGRHPLAALLPAGSAPPTLEDGLPGPDDPLVTPRGAPPYLTAREAAHRAFKRMEAAIPGFRPREPQRRMAAEVARVMDQGGRLAVQAPTGTGKTYAYLLPAAGRAAGDRHPVVIATATKALQQQLRRDAERLRELGLLTVPVRQLQGVANYVCTREVAEAIEAAEAGTDWLAVAVAVRALASDATGVWDDVTDWTVQRREPAYRVTRALLATTSDGCERQRCRWARRCPLMRRLEGSDEAPGILIVNHSLLASWAKLARLGRRVPWDVLTAGSADLVLDEAHALEDSLTGAWTEAIGEQELDLIERMLGGRRGPLRAAREAARRLGVQLTALQDLPALQARLRRSLQALREAAHAYLRDFGGERRQVAFLPALARKQPEYLTLRQAALPAIHALQDIGTALERARGELAAASGDGRAAATAQQRLLAAATRLQEAAALLECLRELPQEHVWVHRLAAEPPAPETDGEEQEDGEPREGPWRYERIPIHVGGQFAQQIAAPAHSVTLTSATLTTGESFAFLSSRLGITVSATEGFTPLQLPSPFNYPEQARLILTSHLPLPVPSTEQEFVEEFAADQVGFLSLSGGRSLVLFASRRRMEAVAEKVEAKRAELAERGVELLVQGRQGRAEILRRFRAEPGTVAYGLRAFEQGFDAPGKTLSYLFIEKPPYPHPHDPVIAARARAVEEAGGDPFLDYVVPLTAIRLAQAFGRLIRSESDRGAVIIADRRMQDVSPANNLLLSALPPAIEPHYAADRDEAWTLAIEFVTGKRPDLSAALLPGPDSVAVTLEALRLVPGEDPTPKLQRAARELFGVEALRPEQLALMRALLAGRDAVGVLPTGWGKSLCFQLPALLWPDPQPTVVVSPLVALIKNQLDELRGRKGIRPVRGITGRTSKAEQNDILRSVAEGQVRLLYVAPERLARDPVLYRALEPQQLAMLVVDEAHCVSAWGHDFRPEFRQITKAVRAFRRSPRLALTATATPKVQQDVEATLEMHDPVRVREPVDRPNLRFRVVRCGDEKTRARELLRIVTAMRGTPGIVYCSRRATAEEVAALLRHAGVRARHYHAGMFPEQREAIQDAFFENQIQAVVATKAFGMGINKPDIHWVVHYNLPDSLDGYAQEAGRAARDRSIIGDCVLLYTWGDIKRQRAVVAPVAGDDPLPTARRLLAALQQAHRRGGDAVFDPEELAGQLGVTEEDLNVTLAWLERAGALERRHDCSLRGTVLRGSREPQGEEERRRFRELFSVAIHATPGVRKQVDFHRLEAERGLDPDQLEQQLVEWSLARLVEFRSTKRLWRVRLCGHPLDEAAYRRAVSDWQAWSAQRLEAMIGYALAERCRRLLLAEHFGDPPGTCAERGQQAPCDTCSGEPAPWDLLPSHCVPDPEELIDVELVALRAAAWNTQQKAPFGEAGLKAALLGNEHLGPGQPLSRGLLDCPQFGLLRHVRGGGRRLHEAVEELIRKGMVERMARERSQGGTYTALLATPEGRRALGGSGA